MGDFLLGEQMAPVIQRIRIANPAAGLLTIMSNGRKATAARKAAQQPAGAKRPRRFSGVKAQAQARNNQGQRGGVSYMATKKQAKKPRSFKKNPVVVIAGTPKAQAKARKRNPQVFMKKSRKRNYKRNPNLAGMSLMEIGKLGVGAVAGTIGTRGIPSLVLKDKNVGAVGILSNLVAGAGLTFMASKLDKTVAAGVAAGSAASIFQRVWDVYITKVLPDGTGKQVVAPAAVVKADGTPKLGDVSYSADGLGDASLGYYAKTDWPQATMPQLPDEQAAFKPAFVA